MKSYLTIIFLLIVYLGFSQAGTNDPTFNTFDNCKFGNGEGFNGKINECILQPDGKILVGGHFTSYNGSTHGRMVRLNPDGSLDGSFVFFYPFVSIDFVETFTLQSDGSILVSIYSSQTQNGGYKVIRLNEYGWYDASFNTIETQGGVSSIKVQNDGKILIGGSFISCNAQPHYRIARLSSDGVVDGTFNSGTGFNGFTTLELQSDGKIIVGGGFTNYNGNSVNCIVRLNSNGSVDPTFNIGTGTNAAVQVIKSYSNGKIIIGGGFTTFNGNSIRSVALLNSNGSLDANFNTPSTFTTDVRCISKRTDGKYMVSGYNSGPNSTIHLLDTDGSLLMNYYSDRYTATGEITQLVGNDIIYFGDPNGSPNICKMNEFGVYDMIFSPQTGFDGKVIVTKIQSDGKILVGGDFKIFNGYLRNNLVRLNEDGSIDTTFKIGTGCNGYVYDIAIQSDKKILIGGSFNNYNGKNIYHFIRLNEDGSIDSTYFPPIGFNNIVYSIAIQNDGKILVGGIFTYYNYTQISKIARLNLDGTLDTSFNVNGGFDYNVNTIQTTNDGKILVGGSFTTYQGIPCSRIVKLLQSGDIDSSFQIGSGFNAYVHKIEIDNSGNILAGGGFTNYNGSICNKLIRLNSNGEVDTTFFIGSGFDSFVYAIAIDQTGSILVGGAFSIFNAEPRNGIVRINLDGSIDSLFIIGTGFYGGILSISIQTDGKYIVGGSFSRYDNQCKNSLIRINEVDVTEIKELSGLVYLLFPNPVSNELTIKGELISPCSFDILDMQGRIVISGKLYASEETIDVSSLKTGTYIFKLDNSTQKIVKL